MGKTRDYLMGLGLAVTGLVGGEVHGRNNAHDAAIIAQADEQKHEFDTNKAEAVDEKEKQNAIAAEQAKVADKKEIEDQAILAAAYNSQLIYAGSHLVTLEDPSIEIHKMHLVNLKKLGEEILKNRSKWLKRPGYMSGAVLARLAGIFTKDEVRGLVENDPSFYQLISNQIAERQQDIQNSQSLATTDEQQGHPHSSERKKVENDFESGLTGDIMKIQTLL